MPYKRSYKKKSKRPAYKRKSYAKKRTMKRRKTYRKKQPDTGTYLKVSSPTIPFIIDNNFIAQSGIVQTPDTYQTSLTFGFGRQSVQKDIVLNDAIISSVSFPVNPTIVNLGLNNADFEAYAKLYKYVQVYKIVVTYIPSVTQGTVLQNISTDATGAVAGAFTTDIARDVTSYWPEYPPDLDGQAKSMSRKVSRTKSIYKGWTRSFAPSEKLTFPMSNPKAEYQYKPKITLKDYDEDFDIIGNQGFVIRCRKPQYSGFPAASIDALDIDFPQTSNYIRAGTIKCHAYIKFIQPFN
ncbi:MAG: putative capsid protein [Cressdnaviricota sp.]|nr:MAG: putative capsid protein [Cressdnaviricota sp.]